MSLFCDLWLELFSGRKEKSKRKVFTRKIDAPPPEIMPVVYLIAGGVGGLCTTLVGHPMDTIKIRLQTMPDRTPPVYTGTYDCLVKVIKQRGLRALYDGLTIQLTSVVPSTAFAFAGYGFGISIQEAYGINNYDFTGINYFIAGNIAGFLGALFKGPAERAYVILQVQRENERNVQVTYRERCDPKYRGPVDVILKLYKHKGLRSIYKGTFLTVVRDMPSCGMYFMIYERLKSSMTRHPEDLPLTPVKTIFAGGIAGIGNWLLALPFDNIKSRLQAAPDDKYRNGLRDVIHEMYMEKGGLISLYRGLIPVIIRAFPANAVCFIGFEYCVNVLNYLFK